jgi:8-oxo-dGTP pyrophosphatase MutT (NUDIX family)
MTSDRPATGERLNRGAATTPRQSASVILLRDGAADLELLLVRRNPAQRFMGGYWVFPGGAVDAGEGEGDRAHRAAAVRELREEAGIAGVDAGELVKYSRWITPELIETRFDTHFFLARCPAGARARVDGVECVDLRWSTPADALEAHGRGRLALVFPTKRHLEELSSFGAVDELLARAREKEVDVRAVQPRIVLGDDGPQVLLPGDPGYAEA